MLNKDYAIVITAPEDEQTDNEEEKAISSEASSLRYNAGTESLQNLGFDLPLGWSTSDAIATIALEDEQTDSEEEKPYSSKRQVCLTTRISRGSRICVSTPDGGPDVLQVFLIGSVRVVLGPAP